MTNLEALTYSVNYPLESNHVEPILVKRGLSSVEVFTQEVANSKAYELAYADVLRFVVTMVNLEQCGKITQAEVSALTGTANAIYRKYGESLIGETADSPTVTILSL